MIFKTLTLNNFRVFKGLHDIDLAPKKHGLVGKPIVLFGGLNGAGKTSILTAIRLILMGRKALGTAISQKEYIKFLIEQINKEALSSQKNARASIELEFTHTHKGKHNTFVVNRGWNSEGTESLKLKLNDEILDTLNIEQTQAILSDLVPTGIGDLFFFDGEKIAELAEDDTGHYLKDAVQKLLGIDVVNRLREDLEIYLKQVTKDSSDNESVKQITALEAEKDLLYQLATRSRQKAEEIRPQLFELRKLASHLENKLQERGGAWAKTKKDEKARADQLIRDEHQISGVILNELDDYFPLALAPNAVKSLFEQLHKEKSKKQENGFLEQLTKLVPKLSRVLAKEINADAANLEKLILDHAELLSSSRQDGSVVLDISDTDFYRLLNGNEASLNSKAKLVESLRKLEFSQSELASLSTNISRAPDEEELGEIFAELRELDKKIIEKRDNYLAHLKEAQSRMMKTLELSRRLEKLISQQKNQVTIVKAIKRVSSAQSALTQFARRLTKLRVSQLEELFVISYRKLARKDELKLAAKINPENFDVSLIDQDGTEINRKSLSAGEKQIFAFAILEALGKLSGKVLPLVVDTPLGRLDSKHRDKLITRYFPEASDQVILLSTDTEVDKGFYSMLEEYVSHSYEIKFDGKLRNSRIFEGYFWKDNYMEVV
ncbi:DNA sulfur modification protein DndD [Pseudidiomarina andamanensis]|uniref:DNA sulfur modification protein DndD n=1 Tax=Pseudidiomarina andamanensis TaxID=1940690 RepID=A0AA92IME8_9GAMM|nr:DNA sulfur modification protein DndD [Pseudidiomarina andamanensis]MDS0219329.1 DNA sulfur modification protein DndD [Pseudidiomarina andamanensis]QGT96059.1 DNA sulfur modification protein DndD [Pseudidiomarina andamanensis]